MTICLPLAFLGIGATELVLVLAVVLILFGPKELPKIARTLGKFMAQIRSVSDDFQSQVMHIRDEVQAPGNDERIVENPSVSGPATVAAESPPVAAEPAAVEPDPADQDKDMPHEPRG